eukprot:CAMPEP_0114618360 /NCGR_PEP_ID=MMETSP0168-20121206/7663_1 /TAXON_ID=95228 ORGANISM="Vannella sp., Strain DIVA3 517/6/12" /NCGR_SAMPLE_ID=MMETSP0168 /ASSEMBLY_ACC=CAM_ASM_000044 /LENGTH=162 /DNA_ID=CAMNT_0001829505 /DNA_START=146 /DNA_END=632 /DNA_ORIENTATION=-
MTGRQCRSMKRRNAAGSAHLQPAFLPALPAQAGAEGRRRQADEGVPRLQLRTVQVVRFVGVPVREQLLLLASGPQDCSLLPGGPVQERTPVLRQTRRSYGAPSLHSVWWHPQPHVNITDDYPELTQPIDVPPVEPFALAGGHPAVPRPAALNAACLGVISYW